MRSLASAAALLLVCLPVLGRGADRQRAPIVLESFVEGEGSAVVMLGGGTRGADEFIPHALVLSKRYRVIRLQTLNISRSRQKQPLPANYSIAMEAEAVGETLNRLNVREPAHFVGHSLGALITLQFALVHPERVRTLTLAEPPAFWALQEADWRQTPDMRAMYDLLLTLGPQVQPTDDQWIRFRCLLGECGLKPPGPGDPGTEEWAARRDALRGLSAVAHVKVDPKQLTNVRKPVLIVTGSSTVSFHKRINEALAAQLPIVDRLDLPGTHAAVITAQEAFLTGL